MAEAASHSIKENVDAHDPMLYRYDGLAPTIQSLDDIDAAAAEQFHSQGYLAVDQAITPSEVNDVRQAITTLVGDDGPGLCHVMWEASAAGRVDQLAAHEREHHIRKLANFHGKHPDMDALIEHADLHAALEKLGCLAPRLFQTMALIKGPGGCEKPWHQDQAYFNTPFDGHRIIGVWIALDDATPQNGCMHIMPAKGDPVVHFHKRDWQICDRDAQAMRDEVLAVQIPAGGVLFFDSLLPHGTPINTSDRRRRAIQLHYAPGDLGEITNEQRMATFGSEGKDVTC